MSRILSKITFLWEKEFFLLLLVIGWFVFPAYLISYYGYHKLYQHPFYQRKYYLLLVIALLMSILHGNYLGIYGAVFSFLGIECTLHVSEDMSLEERYQLLDKLLWFSLLPVLVVVIELLVFRGFRISGTFQNANFLGLFYVFLGLYSLFRYFDTRKWEYGAYYLLAVVMVFISQSRSMLVVIGLMSVIVWGKCCFTRFGLLSLSLLVFFLMYMVGVILFDFPFVRMEGLVGDIAIRRSIFHNTIQTIHQSWWSWCLGYGNHYYERIVKLHGGYFTYHAHNLFLESWLSYGLLGTLVLGRLCYRYYRETTFISRVIIWAVLLVGILDVGIFWHQTGILFLLLVLFLHGVPEKIS